MKANKIVIAPDSFKGCLSVSQVAQAIDAGLKMNPLDLKAVLLPMSDGGDGMTEVFSHYLRVEKMECEVSDPFQGKVKASYLISEDGLTAYIESAKACGINLVPKDKMNPMKASSAGVGELILDALAKGCLTIYIGLGGSATVDGGTGMLRALGWRFLDKEGKELAGCGQDLTRIEKIVAPSSKIFQDDIRFIGLYDVESPLSGDKGAVNMFARQKGADDDMMEALDKGIINYSNIARYFLKKDRGIDFDDSEPGDGAAGGLGFALRTFLGAYMESGIDFCLEISDFARELDEASLVITGEGKLDGQSLLGKVPYKVMLKAREKNVPTVALAGKVENVIQANAQGFLSAFSINAFGDSRSSENDPSLAKQNLKLTSGQIVRLRYMFTNS